MEYSVRSGFVLFMNSKFPLCNYLDCVQCSTLIFLLTCPLGNYVSSFTCQVYFLVAQKKSTARFARCFIEFSILVSSNFMPGINPKREVIWYHCLLTVKSLHKISKSTQSGLNDVYNTWAFVGGFLKSLIDRVHNKKKAVKTLLIK